jgi:hypothetical protein
MSRTLTWIDANGTSTVLDRTSGYIAMFGGVGLDVPPTELNTAKYLSSDGSVLVKRRRGHRRVAFPMFINTGGAASTAVGLAASFFQGPGTLRYTGVNIRELLNVVYETGMEGDWSDDVAVNETWRKLVVGLIALDPWWYGSSTSTALTFAAATAFDAAITFNNAIGFDGSDANPVTIAGDATAFPITTIVGPFTTLQVGVAGGQTFTLAAALAAGSTIIVDTNPGNRGPRLNAGAIDWSLLTPASRLWELPLGSSVLNAAATGTTGASIVEVAWRERWLTP